MNLYIVRHGQSTNNAGLPRVPDPPLTEKGREQARLAALAIVTPPRRIAALYASPMRRAIETAFQLSQTLHLPPHLLPDLCEMGGLGEEAGLCRTDILNEWPTVLLDEAITDAGWWRPLPEEDDESLVYDRASRTLNVLRERHLAAADNIVLVTHGTFASTLLSTLLDLEPCGDARFWFDNCGLTALHIPTIETLDNPASTCKIRLLSHNVTAHIPPELFT